MTILNTMLLISAVVLLVGGILAPRVITKAHTMVRKQLTKNKP